MSLFDEGEEDLVFAGDIAEEEFVSKPAETNEETSTQKSLADYTQKQIFDHLLELFSEKTNPSLDFLDAGKENYYHKFYQILFKLSFPTRKDNFP